MRVSPATEIIEIIEAIVLAPSCCRHGMERISGSSLDWTSDRSLHGKAN